MNQGLRMSRLANIYFRIEWLYLSVRKVGKACPNSRFYISPVRLLWLFLSTRLISLTSR